MKGGLSVNRLAWELLEELCGNSDFYGVKFERAECGSTVVDAGIKAKGGIQAGRIITSARMVSCCLDLSPILVKEAFDKNNIDAMKKLQANLCEGGGHCSFVCPTRIDLKGTMLRAKAALRTK